MAMQIKGPSGTVYNWTKDTPPTEADMAALRQADQARFRTNPTAAPEDPTATSAPTKSLTETSAGTVGALGRAAFDAGTEGGAAAIGQMMGAEFGPAGMSLGGGIGGGFGNYVAQQRKIKMGEQAAFKYGQFLGAVGANMIPGGPLFKASRPAVALEAAKYGFGNLAAKAVETGIDEGRLPTATEAALSGGLGAAAPVAAKYVPLVADRGLQAAKVAGQTAMEGVQAATLAAGRKLGYVVPPTMVNVIAEKPGMLNKTLTYAVNDSPLAIATTIKNQKATNAAAAKYAGIPAGERIDPDVLAKHIDVAEKPYAAVAQLSPAAADNLKGLREARAQAKRFWQASDRTGLPAMEDQARDYDNLAQLYETALENEASAAGKPELLDALREARVKLAKLYMVDRALNEGNGMVSAKAFGTALKSGKVKLTDEGLDIARMALAYPAFVGDVATLSSLGQTRIPVVGEGAKKILMSSFYQKHLADAIPTAPRPDLRALFTRNLIQTSGRKPLLQQFQTQDGPELSELRQ